MNDYQTEQENFWAGDFGDDHIDRSDSEYIQAHKIALWSKILRSTQNVSSVLELGCNVGLNFLAIQKLNSSITAMGYEINAKAAELAKKYTGNKIVCGSIYNELECGKFDLTFTSGVLIHVNPDFLDAVYKNLYDHSNRYVVVAEYYNPFPVAQTYRGHQDQIFKRDFAGDLIDKYDMKLINYGFTYRRDEWAKGSGHDTTWFLLEK